ncbi:hypothetical protein Pmani_034469 [Petrolisthes manimaculis]|uniref:LEM domain-containing protein n=1 Tax=Petrolisthes manimaculis TaxID=1843537 RepID=A0AAE1TRI0_9EUCA|nr:hypothetical protein Pmani_034469 [Petrolisthes manimaculis]
MSGLTKEQLKNQLISHGVGLPSNSAKKEAYVRLYHKYVGPLANSKGDFSSDDDDLPINDIRTEPVSNEIMLIGGINIAQLDDDDLYARLKALGATAGPVVDTTRKVYQRKLFTLMGGHLPDSPVYNGDVDQEYSDSDQEVEQQPAATRRSAHVETSKTTYTTSSSSFTKLQPSQISDIRKRVLLTPGDDNNVEFDPDRHTPSPRRSLRTVTSSSSSSSTTFRKFNNSTSGGVLRESEDVPDTAVSEPGKMTLCLRVTVKLIFLAVILILALYFYQNSPSESPFKAVEQLARQALESAAGPQEAGGDPAAPSPAATPKTEEEQKVFP